MLNGKRVVVVLPAYNAGQTLRRTYDRIPHDIVDEVILTDDKSSDDTVAVARELGITTYTHDHNSGYGANQKTCYRAALKAPGDIVAMLHPDYQYEPRLLTALCSLVAEDIYDVAIGSRILGLGALRGGMPLYKYVSNRFLTLFQNLLIGQKLSEYHTGYRVFSRKVLEQLPLEENSDDFVFDNQMLVQVHWFGFTIGEVSCPTRYADDSSSINFTRSVQYGLGVLWTSILFFLARVGLWRSRLFADDGARLA